MLPVLSSAILRVSTPRLRVLFSSQSLPSPPPPKPSSPHKDVYSSFLPSMVPIFLLGSAVYLVKFFFDHPINYHLTTPCVAFQGLQMAQSALSHERWMDENAPIAEKLEKDVEALVSAKSPN
ncbi:hypothetical protein DL96DRAFT_1591965 [Flagelloscypha sp. PMI_526]|nr:hypothetical protein DL96DRAFT_1591965 [Flagelloscypha sp. PMI_526]